MSILLVTGGFLIVPFLQPILGYHGPKFYYATHYAVERAGHLVFASAALFCAINAYRDNNTIWRERVLFVVWWIVLCIWIAMQMWGLIYWWNDSPSITRPT